MRLWSGHYFADFFRIDLRLIAFSLRSFIARLRADLEEMKGGHIQHLCEPIKAAQGNPSDRYLVYNTVLSGYCWGFADSERQSVYKIGPLR